MKKRIMKNLAVMLTAALMILSSSAPALVSADVFDDNELTEYIFFDSFEDAEVGESRLPNGWSEYARTYEVVEGEASDGNRSVLIKDPSSAGSGGLRTKNIPVTPGKTYIAEFDCRTVKGNSQMYMEFWDANGVRHKSVTILNCVSFRWKTFTIKAIAPEGTVSMTLLTYLHSSNVGDTYYDNIRVYETDGTVPGTEAYVDKDFKSIVNGYPRLYFTAETKQAFIDKALSTKPNYTGSIAKELSENLISNADAYAKEKSFTCSYYGGYKVTYELPLEMPGYRKNPPTYLAGGQYPYWTAMGSNIKARLQTLSLAYLLTGNEKYSRRAIDWCLWLSEWKSWSDPTYGNGTGCLDSGYITFGVCTVYDTLYDVMTEKERDTIKKAIYERSLKAHLTTWNTTTDHNVQMVQTAALGTAGALLLGEYPEAGEAINRAIEYFKIFLDRRMYSGNHEGNMYTSLSMEYMMVAVDHIARVTGDPTVMEHPYMSEFLFEWMIAGGDNKTGSFADIGDASTSTGFFITASVLNTHMKNGYAGYFLKLQKDYGAYFEGLVYRVDDPVVTVPGDELQSVYLKEVGWGSMRTGWNADDTLLVFTASTSTMGHNHPDNNSFLINSNGVWVASDPGYQDYSPGDNRDYTLFDGHSTIYVDGESQVSTGNGEIDERMTSSFFTHMTGDASYNYTNGISEFLRDFILVNHKEAPYFIVRDNIRGIEGEEHEYTWRLNVSNATDFYLDGKKASLEKKAESSFFKTVYGRSAVLAGLFAFDDDLDMEFYQYAGQYGYLLDVNNNKKGDEASYTAVLYTVPSGGNDSYGTYFDEADTGKGEISYTEVDRRSVMLYTPGVEKDELSFDIAAGRSGEYELTVNYVELDYGGLYDVYIDDTKVATIDALNESKVARKKLTAKVTLSRGAHKLRFVNAGSSKMYVKQYLGITGISLDMEDDPDKFISVTEETDNESLSAMTVFYESDSDVILFSKNSPFDREKLVPVSAQNVSANGLLAAVFGINDMTGYALEYGTELSYKGEKLVDSDIPVNISMDGNGGKLTVIAEKAAEVTFRLTSDKITSALIGDSKADMKIENGYASVKFPKGKTTLVFDIDTSSEETPPSVDDVKIENDTDTVMFIIIGIIVAAVIAVAAAAALIAKKKNASK
ncbi:MAG: DUF4962 domain-containing protein [Ruminococcaceae bacterium]|nr:DUF4962 domain-containing protein [Oscillospiraceae bacterium]